MSVGIIPGNVASMSIISATVDLGSVAANTTENETATVPGVQSGDMVFVNDSAIEAGIAIAACNVVSTANTVSLIVTNPTASAVDASSKTLYFFVVRPEGASAAGKVLT